ncbi:hypothetical protein [Pseudomonas veronii]|uniref:hypothetical protein n=1 Tax=Pseudomonas veronii TaxID=76761 RepID=UPI0006257822|nr:hypothetical protein [Pseudomonas veronii]
MNDEPPTSKVFYHPIEAAIRWAGLLRHQQEILSAISLPRNLPERPGCPRWNELRLCTERIYDAIVNRELPFGQNGITVSDIALIDSPDLTVRHIDLKRWMLLHYPEHRPGFLFSRRERMANPFIIAETGQAILAEQLTLILALEQCRRPLREELPEALIQQPTASLYSNQSAISDRAETTYLNIIGGMLALMLGQSPSGTPYSCFNTQEAIISAMIAHYGRVMGIAERTLQSKFAQAKRQLQASDR